MKYILYDCNINGRFYKPPFLYWPNTPKHLYEDEDQYSWDDYGISWRSNPNKTNENRGSFFTFHSAQVVEPPFFPSATWHFLVGLGQIAAGHSRAHGETQVIREVQPVLDEPSAERTAPEWRTPQIPKLNGEPLCGETNQWGCYIMLYPFINGYKWDITWYNRLRSGDAISRFSWDIIWYDQQDWDFHVKIMENSPVKGFNQPQMVASANE